MRESYKDMRSVVVDNAEAAQNMDQMHDNVKVAHKNKRIGLTIVTLSYFLVVSYILVCTWFILTYTLQYGPEDTKLWLGGFLKTFILDTFLISPFHIVLKGVFLLPLVAYITPSLVDMMDNIYESQGDMMAFASGLFEMCLTSVKGTIQRRLLLMVLSPEGELEDDDSLARCMDGDTIEIVI
jgi:hypothetical protein